MTQDELKLLNDLVKIGFPVLGTIAGAVLGAFSTYLITGLNHRNDSVKDRAKRRYDLVLQAANDIAEFEHLIGTYATAVSNKVQGLEGGIDFDEAREAIVNKNQPLRRARMTLKLLGLTEAAAHLEEYLNSTREVVRRGPYLDRDRVAELAKVIVRGPVKVYESLAKELALA